MIIACAALSACAADVTVPPYTIEPSLSASSRALAAVIVRCLDDTRLRQLEESLGYLRQLEERRISILDAIATSGRMTPVPERGALVTHLQTEHPARTFQSITVSESGASVWT
jgi:transcriptional accessory protein Tex/SPT6